MKIKGKKTKDSTPIFGLVFEFWEGLYRPSEFKYEFMPIKCQIFTIVFLKKCFPPISINHKETSCEDIVQKIKT